MDHSTFTRLARIAGSVALLSILTACGDPPPPPETYTVDFGCSNTETYTLYKPPKPSMPDTEPTPSLPNTCVQNPPLGWSWNTKWATPPGSYVPVLYITGATDPFGINHPYT
jgi:hypothetical protein